MPYKKITTIFAALLLSTQSMAASSEDLVKVFNGWLKERALSVYAEDPQYKPLTDQIAQQKSQETNYNRSYKNVFNRYLMMTLTGVDAEAKKKGYTSSGINTECQALDIGETVQKLYDLSIYPLTIYQSNPFYHLNAVRCSNLVSENIKEAPAALNSIARMSRPIVAFSNIAIVLKRTKLASLILNNCQYDGSTSCKVKDTLRDLDGYYLSIKNPIKEVIGYLKTYDNLDTKTAKNIEEGFEEAHDLYEDVKDEDVIKTDDYNTITRPWNTLENKIDNFYIRQLSIAVSANQPSATASPLSLTSLLNPGGYIHGGESDARALRFLSYIIGAGASQASVLPSVPLPYKERSDNNNYVIVNGKLQTYASLKTASGGVSTLNEVKQSRSEKGLQFDEAKREYAEKIRANVATKNIALSNFYDMYAKRVRYGSSPTSSNPNWRIESKTWHEDMRKATPSVIDRQMVYLLAELKQQLVESNRTLERLLATTSMQYIQNDSSSASVVKLKSIEKKMDDLYTRLSATKQQSSGTTTPPEQSQTAGEYRSNVSNTESKISS